VTTVDVSAAVLACLVASFVVHGDMTAVAAPSSVVHGDMTAVAAPSSGVHGDMTAVAALAEHHIAVDDSYMANVVAGNL
jgi:hypothetical protein